MFSSCIDFTYGCCFGKGSALCFINTLAPNTLVKENTERNNRGSFTALLSSSSYFPIQYLFPASCWFLLLNCLRHIIMLSITVLGNKDRKSFEFAFWCLILSPFLLAIPMFFWTCLADLPHLSRKDSVVKI